MDDLANQLCQLGEAVEAATEPTSVAEIVADSQRRLASTIDLDLAAEQPSAPEPKRPAGRRVLLAVAALVLLAAGSAVFLSRDGDAPATLETASAQNRSRVDFAIPPDDNGWEDLRFCESTSIYDIDTGNTFYGAYQFTRPAFHRTVERLALDDYEMTNPAKAPPEIQDAAANSLYLLVGGDAWPVCNRFLTGAQVTPVVPQWIGQSGSSVSTIVFVDPELTDRQVAVAESDIEEIVDIDRWTFVDKQQAYEEFQQMFTNEAQIRESVTVDDMPPSFHIRGDLAPAEVSQLRRITGVFEVVEADPAQQFDPPPPMRIAIPAIELEAPIYPTATRENLARGAVVLGGNAVTPAIAGYGSVAGSVFARLDELRDGDLIEVSQLVAPTRFGPGSQVVRTYVVIGDSAPPPVTVSDLPPWGELEPLGLTLVSDVAGDATQRLVVTAEFAEPETLGYGLESDG